MVSEIVAPVLIADDGELREVRQLLDALDVPYTEIGREAPTGPPLLISNVRHAFAAAVAGVGPDRVSGRFHVVVTEKLSRTMQQEMRRLSADFLLERPVDPLSLRLLVLHALYGGPERRRAERAAMSAVVKYRTGLATRRATLVDLSPNGCRLMTRRELAPGERLSLRLPRELTGGRPLQLRGLVVAVDRLGDVDPGAHAASVAFSDLGAPSRRRVREVMAAHGIGAGVLRPHARDERPTPAAEPRTPSPRSDCEAPERRGGPRAVFERSVLAAGRGGSRVLIGRDPSSGGMRVAPDLHLALGDSFNLVIHGPGGRRPIVVRATVTRDDGEAGCLLRFDDPSPSGRTTLEEIVAALPLLPEEAGRPGPNVVVSEVVEPV